MLGINTTLAVWELAELGSGDDDSFRVRSPSADAPAPIATVRAGPPVAVKLRPFAVLVLEFTP